MIIEYKDGGILRCNFINFYGGKVIADEMYEIDLEEVAEIRADI